MAAVSIILPTYNRPELLKYAIRSVLAQSFTYWKLLVVGDSCSPDTADAVKFFNDPRIFYVNLKDRCGEQSGPNSVGGACATGDYVAYLHHDDLWLADHLATALVKLQASGADMFVGQAAFTTYANFGNCFQPAFNAVSPTDRTLAMAFYHKPTLFEPTSSWVVRQKLVQEIGDWKPARTLIRTPTEDWLLRAWRKGATLANGHFPTTIYCNAEKRKWVKNAKVRAHKMYTLPPEEQEFWWEKLSSMPPCDFRALIQSQVRSCKRGQDYFGHRYSGSTVQEIFEALLTPKTAELFRKSGWDAMQPAANLTGRRRGASLSVMLKHRTGEKLPAVKNWHDVVQAGRQDLLHQTNWFDHEC